MNLIEIQTVLNDLGIVNSISGIDLSSIIECLCKCSLNDDEVGLAELSRLLVWLLGNTPPSLN